MSVNENRREGDFAQYDSMSTEELERILRQDAEAPAEQESDTEKLLYVMEVLARRNRETNRSGTTPQEAWESFQEYYSPNTVTHPGKAARPWMRRLIAAAAAVVLILCIPVTARAFGWEELWDVVAKWAKETFSFVSGYTRETSEPSPIYDGVYTSLQDLLIRSNRPYNMIPTWIPDGFILEKAEKDISPQREVYRVLYKNGDLELTIRVQTSIESDFGNIEIENDPIEILRISEVDYYIFSNMAQIQIIWIGSPYECLISGDLSLEDARKMIDSIEKG